MLANKAETLDSWHGIGKNLSIVINNMGVFFSRDFADYKNN
jgi:hypothetical protein